MAPVQQDHISGVTISSNYEQPECDSSATIGGKNGDISEQGQRGIKGGTARAREHIISIDKPEFLQLADTTYEPGHIPSVRPGQNDDFI
jgi:hypothetical protein